VWSWRAGEEAGGGRGAAPPATSGAASTAAPGAAATAATAVALTLERAVAGAVATVATVSERSVGLRRRLAEREELISGRKGLGSSSRRGKDVPAEAGCATRWWEAGDVVASVVEG
jgi:hypothetical protein